MTTNESRVLPNVDPKQVIADEVDKIRTMQPLISSPHLFLEAQNELLYDRDLSHFQSEEDINEKGLPSVTTGFYTREAVTRVRISKKLPAILNIGSGPEPHRKLDAINVDVSPEGNPDVVADAQNLPFDSGTFTVVRASHILEHITQDQILTTLIEWKRVLHRDGALHIAVPDADTTFQEIIRGRTPKGDPAYSLTESTAPLTQIYGLGYNARNTDERWKHRIIFSYSLLEQCLREAGFTCIEPRTQYEDLAYHCGVDDDSQNHYTLLVSASQEKLPHNIDDPLRERDFREKCRYFKEQYPDVPPASFIIPVHNEAHNLPHFLAFLENAANCTQTTREFIFVVNDCTDNSEQIIRDYLGSSYLDAHIISSERGILRAFKAGNAYKKLHGFVGKLDADTILHPHALDLMQMFLVENDQAQVTYAEPLPLDGQSGFNHAEHNPATRSKRLYYHGRASLYKGSPIQEMVDYELPDDLQAEDIFLSYYYAYFHGLNAIARTPHAFVFARTVSNFEDLLTQLSRCKSEIFRTHSLYPPFKILDKILERQIYPGIYQTIIDEVQKKTQNDMEGWPPIRSTK